MNHNLFFSALVVLLMVANLGAKWITYPACMLRVKWLPDVRSKRKPSSPCPGQVTRAARQPPRPRQGFRLTDFLYCFHDVLAFSCSHLVAARGKKLTGLFQLASVGFRHGNILRLWKSLYLWPRGSLCLFIVKFLAFFKCFWQWSSKYFSNLKKFSLVTFVYLLHLTHGVTLAAVLVLLGASPEWPKSVVQKMPQASASAHVRCGQRHGPEPSHHCPTCPGAVSQHRAGAGTAPKPHMTFLQGLGWTCQ